ncbi:patatin-like phospholipase family protein [Glaciecola sp. 2405UD65-10]|uniref:patatin-like phospholipase family protein n=1 Tax=Glaciecola sp. 2405UD65-10 TaxID=3397244 RepID=UPI003B5BC7DC
MKNVPNTAKINPELALVVEGGGQKGVFTAGIFDMWLMAGFNPFGILLGTSAGAQNLASYISGQQGYAYSLISMLTKLNTFFSPWRMLRRKNVMDLDWYFKQTQEKLFYFDEHKAMANSQNRIVRFSASNPTLFETTMMDPNVEGWLESLKYSSAIPYLYQSSSLVDGGVTAPLPVQQAHDLGAKTILTIRTRALKQEEGNKYMQRIKPFVCFQGRCPRIVNIASRHDLAYEEANLFISRPPSGVRVMELRPQRKLLTKTLGSTQAEMIADYKHGLFIGAEFLRQHGISVYSESELKCSKTVSEMVA